MRPRPPPGHPCRGGTCRRSRSGSSAALLLDLRLELRQVHAEVVGYGELQGHPELDLLGTGARTGRARGTPTAQDRTTLSSPNAPLTHAAAPCRAMVAPHGSCCKGVSDYRCARDSARQPAPRPARRGRKRADSVGQTLRAAVPPGRSGGANSAAAQATGGPGRLSSRPASGTAAAARRAWSRGGARQPRRSATGRRPTDRR